MTRGKAWSVEIRNLVITAHEKVILDMEVRKNSIFHKKLSKILFRYNEIISLFIYKTTGNI